MLVQLARTSSLPKDHNLWLVNARPYPYLIYMDFVYRTVFGGHLSMFASRFPLKHIFLSLKVLNVDSNSQNIIVKYLNGYR